AAGMLAVAGAQAADLPVKAKPVQYVKICTLYGDGFYYIPGSDTCLKIAGYIRADYGYNVHTNVPHYSGDAGARDRNANRHPFTTRHRANIQNDTRTQTAYGTLRTFASLHFDNRHTTDANDINDVEVTVHRAFIQWAGFTIGHTQSFTDVPGQLGDTTMRSLHQAQTESTTGATGINQIAYTWQLGNGMTLNVGADERRVRNLANRGDGTGGVRIGGAPGVSSRTGQHAPTPWISFRVNQAWGEFAAAFIAQQNRASYYTDGATCIQPGTTLCGHPDNDWAWGARAGAKFNVPMFGPGDYIGISGYYSEGAVRLTAANLSNPSLFGKDPTVAIGWVADAVYLDNGQFEQTTAWSVNGGYAHYWTPNFSTTWYGGYVEVSYNDTVINGNWFCGGNHVTPLSGQRCDPGFALFHVGSHTDWYPVRGFRLAVDVLYTGVDTAMAGFANIGTARGNRPTGIYEVKDRGITSVMFRAQRNWGGR
ncbi:MAG: porin, partial [Xanthobacteraceae bacterium]